MMKDELETTVTMDYLDKRAFVYSNHAPTMRLLNKLAEEKPDEVQVDIRDQYGIGVYVPLSYIRIKSPAKRTMTEEAKQKATERLLASKQ